MTQLQPLSQRLREWREGVGWSIADLATHIGRSAAIVEDIEAGHINPGRLTTQALEELMNPGPVTRSHDSIVAAAAEAVRAGLANGCTSVKIVRCETATSGRVVIIIGDTAKELEL
jgi:ribosome-binding protein aMBF1 (putative translation factor)